MYSLAGAGQLGPIGPGAIWGAMLAVNSFHIWANPCMFYTTWTCSVANTDLIDLTRSNLIYAWILSTIGVVVAGMNYIG
jgi:hypothetical protein